MAESSNMAGGISGSIKSLDDLQLLEEIGRGHTAVVFLSRPKAKSAAGGGGASKSEVSAAATATAAAAVAVARGKEEEKLLSGENTELGNLSSDSSSDESDDNSNHASAASEIHYVAVKRIEKKRVASKKQVERVFAERSILKKMGEEAASSTGSYSRNRFVIRLLNTFKDADYLYFVMELAAGGELYKHIRGAPDSRMAIGTARIYAAQICLALESLHKHLIVFRDLKGNNVMLTSGGEVRLIDFGYAKDLNTCEATGDGSDQRAYSFVGTAHAMAPEMIRKSGHGLEIDWWAFGILLYEMLTGKPIFFDMPDEDIFAAILKGVEGIKFAPVFQSGCGDYSLAEDLIRGLLKVEPKERLGGVDGASQVNIAVVDRV